MMTEKPKREQSVSSVLLFGIVAVTGFLVIVGVALVSRPSGAVNDLGSAAIVDSPSDFNGVTALDTAVNVPDFTLTNQEGVPTALSDLRGKPTLIFFGFTHCPDVCPTTLGEYRRIHEALGEQVNFVFISIDGERDTSQVMKAQLEANRVPFVIGLTAPRAEVLKAVETLGIVAEPGAVDTTGNYNMAHTASVFVLNAEGEWIAKYAYGTPADVMIDDLNTRL